MKNCIIVLALIPILFLMGCGKKGEEEIKIGVVMSLTGNGSAYGKFVLDGMELARIEKNVSFKDIKFTFQVEDDKTEPQIGVAAATKLISLDRVKIIIGPIASSVALAVTPICEKNKVIMMSPAASTPKLTNAGDYIFRIYPSDSYEGVFLANFIYLKGLRKVSLIYLNNDFGFGLQDAFSRKFQELGGTVAYSEAFPQDAVDFRAQLAKVKSSYSDGLYFIATVKEYVAALRQAKQVGLKIQIFCGVQIEDSEVIKNAGVAAEGVIYSRPAFDINSPDSTVHRFRTSFRNKYGVEPNVLNALGYDATRLVIDKIKENKNNQDIKALLYRTKDYPGAAGKISFDKYGDVLKELQLMIIKDGKFIPYLKK